LVAEIVIILLIVAGGIVTPWVLLAFNLSSIIRVALVVLEATLLLLVVWRAIAIATSIIGAVERMVLALIDAWYVIKYRVLSHRGREKRPIEIIIQPFGRKVVVTVMVDRDDIERIREGLALLDRVLRSTQQKDAEEDDGREE